MLTAEPTVFVTVIFPVVAPIGTVAVIVVGDVTLKVVAVAVLNLTLVVPQKLVPEMYTTDPMLPNVGANDVTVGAAAVTTVKLPALVAFSPASTTVNGAVPVEPTGTLDTITVSEAPALIGLFTAPGNVTAVAVFAFPVNPEPVMVTGVPTTPHAGVNPVTVSAAANAGIAVARTATTPSAAADATTRVDTFFIGDLTEVSSLLDVVAARDHDPTHLGRRWLIQPAGYITLPVLALASQARTAEKARMPLGTTPGLRIEPNGRSVRHSAFASPRSKVHLSACSGFGCGDLIASGYIWAKVFGIGTTCR